MCTFTNLNYIAGIEKFKGYNKVQMGEVGLKALLDIPVVVEIIKK